MSKLPVLADGIWLSPSLSLFRCHHVCFDVGGCATFGIVIFLERYLSQNFTNDFAAFQCVFFFEILRGLIFSALMVSDCVMVARRASNLRAARVYYELGPQINRNYDGCPVTLSMLSNSWAVN